MSIFRAIKRAKTTNNTMEFPTENANQIAIQTLERKEKYQKPNCDMKELTGQQNLLKQVILSNGKQDFFTVFNMECNVGKTHTAIHTIPYYFEAINKGEIPPKGILIVIREIEECDKYEKLLNGLYALTGDVALAFNSEKYKSKKESLSKMYQSELLRKVHNYPVVFITHENYLKMALNKKLRNTFTKDRRLLIIDESIDICKTLTVEKKELEKMTNRLSEEDKEKLTEICRPIQEKFDEVLLDDKEINNQVFNFKVDIDTYLQLIKHFKKVVENSYTDKQKTNLLNLLIAIECIYTDTCIINKKEKSENCRISVMNRNQKMWLLDNNIILDGSADLQPQYTMNPNLYYMMNNKRVLDHSKWNIEYVYTGSTKSAKGLLDDVVDEKQEEKNDKFYQGCSAIIKDLGEKETFVVCTKDEHITTDSRGNEIAHNPYEDYDCNIPKEHIQHFGNITGKNNYGNLKNVLIAHTINYPETDYILKYMYFTNKRYEDNTTKFRSHQTKNLGGIYIFEDKELQEMKEKTIANHLYQAICRVNRNMEYKTKVIIVSRYVGAILYVRDMLDCDCEQTDKYNSVFDTGKNKVNEERHENSKASVMCRLFEKIMSGEISSNIPYIQIDSHIIQIDKEDIRNYLNYTKVKFSQAVGESKEFIRNNAIIYNKKNFVFILDSPLE